MAPTPLLAIAHQTVRRAVRSRLAVALLLPAALLVLLMPLLVRDDGTFEGRYRVLLVYTLNGSLALLFTAALWSACAAVAIETTSRRLHLVVVKPVSAATLWFGQWLGLTGFYGCLLAIIWVATLGQLARQTAVARRAAGSEAPLIAATARMIRPHPGPEPQSAAAADPPNHLRLAPGQTRTFRFRLPRHRPAGKRATLELLFASSHARDRADSPKISLVIDTGGAGRESRERIHESFAAGRLHRIDAVSLAEATDGWLHVSIRNQAFDPPVTLLIHRHNGLRLRMPAGGRLNNHLRAGLILSARLGFFIAVGLTAGIMFSFPVAAFVGGFWLLFASLAGYIQSVLARGVIVIPHEGPTPDPTTVERGLLVVYRLFDIVLSPLRHPPVIQRLGSNTLIEAQELASGLGIPAIVYIGLLAVAGIMALRRRETAAR